MSLPWVFLLLTVCTHSTHGQFPIVYINDCGGTIIARQSCTLVCNVSGLGSSNPTVSYHWIKNNGTTQAQVGNKSDMLAFSSLRLSDAGQYTCQVTVGSETYGFSEYIHIQIPTPHSLTLSSTPGSPIRPIGTNVTLKCTVELSSSVDVPVTLNIQLSDPFGSPLNTTISESGSSYTITAMISSFGRNQSGYYTCTASLTSVSLFLTNSRPQTAVNHVTVGVYLFLRGNGIMNNSIVFFTEIGETYNYSDTNAYPRILLTPPTSLQCITDKSSCCVQRGRREGEWYLPDRTRANVRSRYGTSLYRDRAGDGSVNLNRRNDAVMSGLVGLYCCELSDSQNIYRTLCANIVSTTITYSGMNTAGETFTLECYVNGTNESTIYQWSDIQGQPIISDGSVKITNFTSVSYLQFSPLRQTHQGVYTCNAVIAEATESKLFNVSVNVPLVTAQISDGNSLPVAGLSYTLTCNVLGAGNLNPTLTYLWTKSSIQIMAYTNALHFHSLQLSDAGEYTCQVTVRSPYLFNEVTAAASYSIILEFPAPRSIALASNKPNPIRPVGSAFNLTCTVVLSPAVDVPVTVTIQLSDPAGSQLTTTSPSVSGSSHTVSTTVYSFGRRQSGIYTCTVNSSSTTISSFITGSQLRSKTARITAG